MFNHAHMSGKVIAAALFGVALLLFAIWQSPLLGGASRISSDNSVIANEDGLRESAEYSLDSDGDGVRDWEETLLGLDPNNADSNSDGISDGEELAAARAAYEQSAEAATTSDQTQTDLVAREIFGAYIQSKQQGTYDPQAFDALLAQVADEQFGARYTSQYTKEDLVTTADVSPERTLQYEQEFQVAITPVTNISEYELTTYGRALESGDEAEFQKLMKAATIYKQIAQNLLRITHLDMVNSFDTFARILEGMGSSPEDPVLTFVATRNFIEGEDMIKAAYSQIGIYFTLKESETI